MLVCAALMLTAWWGVDTFVLSDDLPGGGDEAAGLIERPVAQDAEASANPRSEPVVGTTGRPPVRLEGSRAPADTTQAAITEAAAAPGRRADTTSEPGDDEEIVTSGDLRPGTTSGGAGDDVIVGNTFSLAENDEVWVDPGYAWVGTPQRQIEGLLGTRVENVPLGIRYEAPRHAVLMEGYWFGRTEVPNRLYLRFLEQAAGIEFTTPVGKARTPVELVAAVIGPRAPHRWDVEVTARQLVEANRGAVHAAVPELVVRDPATRNVDEEATWESLKDAALPNGVDLRFYDRAPPAHWPDDRFAAGRVDHPVRGLSLEDATALALWAGRHVPDELEWEYAARGARGAPFPWGTNGQKFDEYVNGGRRRKHGEAPDTLTVRSLPDGASWVGALNLLGNVAEWTSSRLMPYPDSDLEPLDRMVYRGGSAADEEPLVVRPAYRGWVPGVQGDPTPAPWNQQRYWVGARLARYEEPARSQTVAMRTRYLANPDLPADALEPRVYAGAQGVLRGAPLGNRRDATVRPGTKSVVAQPLRYVLVPGGREHRVPKAVTEERGLHALSRVGVVAFGLLHTDLQLLDVWSVELREGRNPRLRRAACPPGTWLVVLHEGYLALVDPVRPVMYYLTRTQAGRAVVGVHRRTPRRDGEPHLAATLAPPSQGPRVQVGLELPLGNATRADLVVRVRFDLQFEGRVLQAIEDWETGSLDVR